MKKSPVCFIAMAFGWDDTDAFYEKQILPTLKRNGIKPVIINRHQSNDDLNFQIFEQLIKADFCIADLTYTRPSVYFEAGYAQRAIPVIYTARKDHLGKGQPEDLRVHFDLQMKPIIDWKDEYDSTFSNRLEKRIKATFLKEWNKKQKSNIDYEKDEKEFQSLPGFARLSGVRYQTILALKKLGYKESSWDVNARFDHFSYDKGAIRTGAVNYVYGHKVDKKNLSIVAVQSFLSPSKKELINLEDKYTSWFSLPKPILMLLGDLQFNTVQVRVITISLNPLPAGRIEAVLPGLTPIENSKIYSETLFHRSLGVYSKFYFVSGIKSLRSLREKLNDVALDMQRD